MSETTYKAPAYNSAHEMKKDVDPKRYVTTALSYEAASRLFNLIEDVHAQMQRPQEERFKDYPIEDFEKIDTVIRDNMANLALSIETLAVSERNQA